MHRNAAINFKAVIIDWAMLSLRDMSGEKVVDPRRGTPCQQTTLSACLPATFVVGWQMIFSANLGHRHTNEIGSTRCVVRRCFALFPLRSAGIQLNLGPLAETTQASYVVSIELKL